jgi:hypothetical protein
MRNNTFIAIISISIAAVAWGATVGDPNSFAKYGVVFVPVSDGGSGSVACVGVSKQNSVMVRNYINDGGTSAPMYCGFDTKVTNITGMPVLANETITIDIVALQSTVTNNGADGIFDGGAVLTKGSIQNQLCCTTVTTATDEHWMIVK